MANAERPASPSDGRYPSLHRDPRELRPRRANAIAALALLGLLVAIIVALALVG